MQADFDNLLLFGFENPARDPQYVQFKTNISLEVQQNLFFLPGEWRLGIY